MRSAWLVLALVFGLTLLPGGNARATSVLQLDFAEVADTAELIFEGRVLSLQARRMPGGAIHTFVRFRVLDVVKGDHPGDEIELSFLGGRVGDAQLQVAEMQMPVEGETGFYFVESLRRPLVHPLVGWKQGHYLIEAGTDGDAGVYTANHRRITGRGLSRPGFAPPQLSDGEATGLELQYTPGGPAAMSPAEFREMVRQMIRDSLPAGGQLP